MLLHSRSLHRRQLQRAQEIAWHMGAMLVPSEESSAYVIAERARADTLLYTVCMYVCTYVCICLYMYMYVYRLSGAYVIAERTRADTLLCTVCTHTHPQTRYVLFRESV